MEIQFSSEQKEMQQFIRDFAIKEISPYIESMERGKFPEEIVNKMGVAGLMGLPIPKQYGGAGKDFISYIIALHEISKISAAVGLILSVHTSVGSNPILKHGSEWQREYYLPKLTSGEFLGAFALTEPNAGSDAARLKLKAEEKRDAYLLNGTKIFITNGKEADTFITFARTNKQEGAKGISAFIIEKNIPGITVGKNENKMGLHGTSTVMLHFEGCQIPKHQLLGEEGQGFQVAMANLNNGRLGIAAQALGIAEAVKELITMYVKENNMKDQLTLFKLADMETKAQAARLLVYQAASRIEKNIQCVKEVSMAKLFVTKIAREFSIEAMQIAGTESMSKDLPLERFFRDAKVTEIYEGTSEIQRMVISKRQLQ